MLHLGYKLSSEEFGPSDLIQHAARAEAAGFDFALISDHFHPSRYLDAIRKATRAGYDHVCLHQVGPEQEGFIRFFDREIRPRLRRAASAPRRVPQPRRRAA